MTHRVNADTRRKRGSVVMLVDNGVTDDSRVQKAALSTATAGWNVTVLGCSPDSESRTWTIGAAVVRLLPLPVPLAKRRHEFRRRWLLAPLAYPPTGIADQRRQAVRAWRANLAVRRAQLDHPGATRARSLLIARRATLAANEVGIRIVGTWVAFRAWQLRGGQRLRRRLNTPWDRAYTWFWQMALGDRSWRRLEPGLWDYELAYGPRRSTSCPRT